MKPRQIYVVGGDTSYACWMEGEICRRIEDADFVVFTGGEDVDPTFYNMKPHPFTRFNTERDEEEKQYFDACIRLRKRMVGICRGSQFLCVMSGGILVQHQANPGYMHKMKTFDKKEIWVSSTHHQAQYPWKMKPGSFRVLGWTYDQSPFHEGGEREELVLDGALVDADGKNDPKEVEVAYYPETKCLAIQSHPEMIFPKRFVDAEVNTSIEWMRTLLNRHQYDTIPNFYHGR